MQGLNVVFVGPVDLSVDFGVPGQLEHPSVGAYLRELETAAARTGTMLGAFVGTAEQAGRLVAKGYRYLAVSGDITLLSNGARMLAASLRDACGTIHPAAESTGD